MVPTGVGMNRSRPARGGYTWYGPRERGVSYSRAEHGSFAVFLGMARCLTLDRAGLTISFVPLYLGNFTHR
jgi:hypothetical protein